MDLFPTYVLSGTEWVPKKRITKRNLLHYQCSITVRSGSQLNFMVVQFWSNWSYMASLEKSEIEYMHHLYFRGFSSICKALQYQWLQKNYSRLLFYYCIKRKLLHSGWYLLTSKDKIRQDHIYFNLCVSYLAVTP